MGSTWRYLTGKPGPSGFGSGSTCFEVAAALEGGIKGKVVLITGTTSGIGRQTAMALARQGATVVMAARNREANARVAAEVRAQAAPGSVVHELELDLTSMDSVRNCAKAFNALDLPLHVLINNAGVMIPPFTLTAEGWELQFGTNHLGHFLLCNLLAPKLKASAPSRIVCVASTAHAMAPKGGVKWDALRSGEEYLAWTYYGQSKLANMLHALALSARLEGSGVTAVSLHPGGIKTDLGRHSPVVKALLTVTAPLWKSEPQGAAMSVHCAFAPLKPGSLEAGGYHSDCNVDVPGHAAFTRETADKLWQLSVEATSSDLPA